MLTRAQRNNNPGNLNAGEHWQGLMVRSQMTPEQAAEPRFAVFETAAYGFRALCVLLLNYESIYGLNTPRKIIGRWAPSIENNTAGYIARVSAETGKGEDEPVDLKDARTLSGFAKAIATVESGAWLFNDTDLQIGVAMALRSI